MKSRFTRFCAVCTLTMAGLATTSPATAAEWTPLSATCTGCGSSSATDFYGDYNFKDGEPTATRFEGFGENGGPVRGGAWPWRNSPDPATTSGLIYFGAAPVVDLTPANERIKVRNMQWLGSYPPTNDGSDQFDGWLYESAIGYNLTPLIPHFLCVGPNDPACSVDGYIYSDWAPLVVNADGSYTATWQWHSSGESTPVTETLDTMSITFRAAPVPEPAQAVLFALGLMGVAARIRRRRVG